jgi:transcriptional regulator with XRE-family HTH domain
VQRSDTPLLNQTAVAERLRELQLKQWWVARQIGVTKLTVNRWLTGKVRHISRDNLVRLAEVLQAGPEDFIVRENAVAPATQVEQNQAAQLLSDTKTLQMFSAAGQLDVYEQMVKAVMHPNMALADLTELYSRMCQALGGQFKYKELKDYAGRGLDYAQRCGNLEREMQFRNNLIVAEGGAGKLAAAVRGMEEQISSAESAGLGIVRATACVNLSYALRLLGKLKESVKAINEALDFLDSFDDPRANLYALSNASLMALELGQFDFALGLRREGFRRAYNYNAEDMASKTQMMETLVDALAGRKVSTKAVRSSIEQMFAEGPGDDSALWPSITLRLAGEAQAAADFLERLRAHPSKSPYREPFQLEEEARTAWALKRPKAAEQLRRQANEAFAALGMRWRIFDDPASEFGSQFTLPVRLRIRDPRNNPGSLYPSA